MGGGRPPVVISYTTLDPAKMGTVGTLSGGDLTFSNATGSWSTVLSVAGMSSGKRQFEFSFASSTAYVFVGIASSAKNLNTYLGGSDSIGYGYYYNGQKSNGTSQIAYGSAFNAGDIVTGKFDVSAGTLEMLLNGTSQGVLASGISGTQYIAISTLQGSAAVTLNSGGSAFSYPTAGFIGVY